MAKERKPCKRCGREKLPGRGQRFCAICKPIATQEQEERDSQAKAKYNGKTTKSSKAVPTELRKLWGRAHPNSAIRKKFPTAQSLKNYSEET